MKNGNRGEGVTTIRKRVADAATAIIKRNPGGIRWADLHRAVARELNEKQNTIHGSLYAFSLNLPAGFHKPERGVYVYSPDGAVEPTELSPSPTRYREEDFYEPFANWLKDEVEEATIAKAIGGNLFGGKWGTPDVMALYRPRKTDPIQFTEEVIAAEIKIDTSSLITAFGQACAYKLFAHRVYIVVPRTAPDKDLRRLDALAAVVGIGLVKFNPDSPDNPEFSVMARAAKHEPDYFYTNATLDKCKAQLEL